MFNVTQKVNSKKLILEVDLLQPGHISKSGKSTVIASTEGNVSVDSKPEIKFGLNVYTPR